LTLASLFAVLLANAATTEHEKSKEGIQFPASSDLSEYLKTSSQKVGITNSFSPDTVSTLLHDLADEMIRNFMAHEMFFKRFSIMGRAL
jgi:hypothetical protein